MKETTQFLGFTALGVAMLLGAVVGPFDEVADVNLVLHHFQHVIIIFGGFSVGYGLSVLYRVSWTPRWARFKTLWAHFNKGGYVAAALFMIVFNFWHIPQAFTFTVLPGNEGIHEMEHAMFFVTAALLIAATPFMSRTLKTVYIFVFGNMNSMMGLLYSVWGTNLFAPYPAYQQNQFGLVMSVSGFFTMTVGTFLYAYLSRGRLTRPTAENAQLSRRV